MDGELPQEAQQALKDVDAVYRRLVMQLHPDRGGDAALMAAVNEWHQDWMRFVGGIERDRARLSRRA